MPLLGTSASQNTKSFLTVSVEYLVIAGGGSGGSDQAKLNGGIGTTAEGYDGGRGGISNGSAGSGGGASANGTENTVTSNTTPGGDGLANSITGSSVTYAAGGSANGNINAARTNATANTGNGGDSAYNTSGSSYPAGANGGSGVVILRSVSAAASTTGSPVVTTPTIGGTVYNVYQFNNTGSITF